LRERAARQRFAPTVKDRWGESSNGEKPTEPGFSSPTPLADLHPAQMVPSDGMFLNDAVTGRT
jgi:hypothetical protein